MAKFNFKEAAQKALANSPLQVGRVKKQWADVDGKPVTIIGFDQNDGPAVDTKGNLIVDDDTGEVLLVPYTTVLLKEFPDNFFGGFKELDRMMAAISENFEGMDELNRELAAAGGIKIQTRMTMRNGKNIRKVDIID